VKSLYEIKIREGVAPFLGAGEEVLEAIVVRPRGWTQSSAAGPALSGIGLRKQGRVNGTEFSLEANAAADGKGLVALFERARAGVA
jgi:hypothetical protein